MTDDERSRDPRVVDFGELPELTRGLRAMGSYRRGGSSQSLFFNPLLEARRRAADARTAQARVRAFDASDLSRALEKAIERIVSEWPDVRMPARRALRAELLERVGPYTRELALLSERAIDVGQAEEADRLRAWRAWTTQLAAVFATADRCWLSIRTVVESVSRNRNRGDAGKGPRGQE